jgi:hypothetical protein
VSHYSTVVIKDRELEKLNDVRTGSQRKVIQITYQIGKCDVKVMDSSNIHKLTKFTADLTVLVKSLYVACRFSVREC